MHRRARLMWWWRLPVAVGLALLATNNPPPFLFGKEAYEQTAFIVAALLMVLATLWPRSIFLTVAATTTAVAAFMGRAMVLIFVDSFLTKEQITRGVVTWTLGSFLVVMLTIALDRPR